eukprot:s6902_g2.t1
MGHIGAPGLIPEAFFLDFQEESDDRAATDADGEGADSSSLERSRAQGVGHPYGGLATGAVQFLGIRLDYVLPLRRNCWVFGNWTLEYHTLILFGTCYLKGTIME